MTVTVRKALITDWMAIRDLLYAFWADEVTPALFANAKEHPDAERLLVNTLSQNCSFIAFDDSEPAKAIGMLIAIRTNILFITNRIIEEMAWYVLPEHRHSRAGYLLLSSWEALIDQEKRDGLIEFGVLHTMSKSPIDLKSRGYEVADTTFTR